MKLLYIVQYFHFPDETGGTRPYDLAHSFVKKGIDVTIITSNIKGNQSKRWELIERDGLKIYYLSCPYSNKMGFWKRIMSFFRFFTNATCKALVQDYDLMLSSSTPLTNGIPALITKWFKKKPYVFEVRDVWPSVPIAMGYFKNKLIQKFLYAFEKCIYKNASYIIPLSVGMNENIQKRYPNKKSIVIPNISEISRFSDTEANGVNIPFELGKKVLLYAGTLGNVNGLSYLIDLAEKTLLIDSNVLFYVIGNGKEKKQLEEVAKEKGVLNQNFFLFDPVKKKDLPYLYSCCTVGSSFVIDIPELWDNSANKFFDTLAAHRPMVINHRGWQADEIEKYNFGYVLPPVVDDKVASDFVKYIKNEELLSIQGVNAFRQAEEKYALDVAISKYLQVFTNVDTVAK